MPTTTTNYGLSKPLVNDPVDQDVWGNELNSDMDDLDSLMKTGINWLASSKSASFSVTAPTSGSTDTGSANTFFLCDATAGSIVASLPSAASAGNGFTVAFKKVDASINTLTLDGSGSETIDGATTLSITAQNNSVAIVCDGSNWKILSNTTSAGGGGAPIDSPAFTGTPTAPTPTLNDSSTRLATTAFANPANSLSSSGYQKFSSGLIIQWGSQSVSNNSTASVTLPVSFSSAIYVATVTFSGTNTSTDDYDAQVSSLGTSSFSISNPNGNSRTAYWIAIGR